MIKEQEALKLALEALEAIHTHADVACVVTPDGAVYLQPAITAIKEALAQPAQEPVKLWLWKNFVEGKPEYWAFDNPFPIFMDSHDPQTLGEPCGYAWIKPSRTGRTDVSDEQVLQAVQKALAQPKSRPTTREEKIVRPGVYETLEERNFCPRCGKRTTDIHTCTSPNK